MKKKAIPEELALTRAKNSANVNRGAGDIPSFKLIETEKILAYLDIQPLSKGHAVWESNCPPPPSPYLPFPLRPGDEAVYVLHS